MIRNDKTVLVIGASGFIGSCLCQILLKNHFRVIALDKNNMQFEKTIDNLKMVNVDITKPFELKNCFNDIDVVVHLAGIVGENACSRDIQNTYDVNITGLVNTISSVNDLKLSKFIYLSSVSVYDESNEIPICEEGKINNSNIYNSTKLAAEELVAGYCKKFNIPYNICRLTTTYGPHQPNTTILSLIISTLLKQDQMNLLYPFDEKDLVFVADVAEAIMKFISCEESGIFNVCTEQGVKLADIVKMVGDILNKEVELGNGDKIEALKNNRKFIYDNSKLKNLGWKPMSELHDGLLETINYFKDQNKGN